MPSMAVEEGTQPHVDQRENLADLIARIDQSERPLYDGLGHIFSEAAFINRRFLVVTTQGATSEGPRQPKYESCVVVTNFICTPRNGSVITLSDSATGRSMQAGHVPVRLFNYPVYVSVPIYQGVRWEAREQPDGSYRRTLVFGICFKQRSSLKFYNRGNVAVVTPNEYRRHFGDTLPRW